jgi:hypothetical protein
MRVGAASTRRVSIPRCKTYTCMMHIGCATDSYNLFPVGQEKREDGYDVDEALAEPAAQPRGQKL